MVKGDIVPEKILKNVVQTWVCKKNLPVVHCNQRYTSEELSPKIKWKQLSDDLVILFLCYWKENDLSSKLIEINNFGGAQQCNVQTTRR